MSTSVSNSSLTGVTLNVTSGTPPVNVGTQTIPVASLSVGANSVQITDPDIVSALGSGTTIDYSLSCSYANGKSVVLTAGTPYVPPSPPPPVMLDTNGVTLKYTLSSIPSGQPNPYIVQVSGTYYAVMSSNNDDSKSKITAYAANFSQPITNPYVSPFVANGTKIPFNQIVTTLMTDMSNMFYSIGNFNSNISSWDTSSVTNMTSMFNGASLFNNGNNPGIENSGIAGIGYWYTSKVTNMSYMFSSCSLNSNIGSWDVSSVINMEQMFHGSSFTNGNNNHPSIGSWQTLNVKNMKRMFHNCYYFNRDISTWNVSGLSENPMPLFSQNSSLTNAQLPLAFRV
jgi:surface protein